MPVDIARVSAMALLHNEPSLKGPRIPMSPRWKLLPATAALLFMYVNSGSPQANPAPKSAASKDSVLPSVDELVEKCAKGSGGKEAWAKLSTLVLTGTMEIPSVGMTGKVELFAKAPNKSFHVIPTDGISIVPVSTSVE